MNTLKEQQVTSLSELLKNAKKAEQTSEQKSNNKVSAVDKATKNLNSLFEKYWTPLFDENKEYPMWNDGILIYFGQGMNDYFRVEQTPINKIVLVKCPASNRVTYPDTITKSYNKILLMIITLHMYKDFKKEVDFYEVLKERNIRHAINSFQDLIDLIGFVSYDTLNENHKSNTIEIKNYKIKISPTLEFAKNYYYKLYSTNIKNIRQYVNENSEFSEILFERLMTHQDSFLEFKETVNQLVQIYSEMCDMLLPKSDIQPIKKQFVSLCKKYDLDSNNYRVAVTNWHNYKFILSVAERGKWGYETFEEYLKNNSNYRALKAKEKGTTAFDYQDLENKIKARAFEDYAKRFAQKFYEKNKSKIEELKKIKFLHKRDLKFKNEKLSIFINSEYSRLQITHNNFKFYRVAGALYDFTIDSFTVHDKVMELPFEEIQKLLEASAEVIEKFINS